jgi:hypothetical protein
MSVQKFKSYVCQTKARILTARATLFSTVYEAYSQACGTNYKYIDKFLCHELRLHNKKWEILKALILRKVGENELDKERFLLLNGLYYTLIGLLDTQ